MNDSNKPLSETHPTFWKLYILIESKQDIEECVRSCTVDRAEHEALKKELEECHDIIKGEMVTRDYAASISHEAFKAGERRAMQKVKETILRLDKQFSKGAFQPTLRSLYRELGLGEVKK
jgi:hypothetical protein